MFNKSLDITITNSPKNAMISYCDYDATKIVGSYKKNVRTAKANVVGSVPNFSKIEKYVASFMKATSFVHFSYIWIEIEGIIRINFSNSNSNISIEMHDDLEDAFEKIWDIYNDNINDEDRVDIQHEDDELNVRMYGDRDEVYLILEDTNAFEEYAKKLV